MTGLRSILGRFAGALLITLIVLGPGPSAPNVAAQEHEERLKAEFVERFTHFITWPESAPQGALVVGVLGPSPITRQLESAFADRNVNGPTADVRRVSRVDDIEQCHILFVPAFAAARIDSILEHSSHLPILTIGDSEGLADHGVLINFYRDGEYLRFEINRPAVDASGLKFSSDLLRMARLVEENPP